MGYNKKGQGISLNFLIIAALALIALIVIALFFTGGISKLFGKKADVIKASEQELVLAKASCELWCSTDFKENYQNPPFAESIKNAGFIKCKDFDGLDTWDLTCVNRCKGTAVETTKTCNDQKSEAECRKVNGCSWT